MNLHLWVTRGGGGGGRLGYTAIVESTPGGTTETEDESVSRGGRDPTVHVRGIVGVIIGSPETAGGQKSIAKRTDGGRVL